ncbi:MAG TPA: 4'-phosphopantetheinyl transferase superfamily protein [Candidatus Binatia bacterium]|nr:4'-phosphopantetheinyl transferase superfamily protein [Candidatus Binatia bacterium]
MKVTATAPAAASWRLPPETLALEPDEVHVWRAALDQPLSRVENLLLTLAADERIRAERFYFRRDREHFIVARGVLRAILGRYLNSAPGQLSFCYSPFGKPALAEDVGGAMLHFNVSHSHGLALYAVTRGKEVGIDLERIRPDLAIEQIAERFFSGREVATLRALPKNTRTVAFFLCWTRKEAYIKARGEGLSLPLDQFDVSLIPGKPATLLRAEGAPHEASRWSLHDVAPIPSYTAALAVEGRAWRLACWQWQ